MNWRFIDTGPRNGCDNMAIDEALFYFFEPSSSLPILRLYGWEPPALSVGRFQNPDELVDLETEKTCTVPVVRRMTGGGAIFHRDEITYSIICSQEQIQSSSSVKESFRLLTSFLLGFYRALGLDAAYAVDRFPGDRMLGERTPFCFAGRESYDILIGGRKIGGNAQRRTRKLIFQHGSIPLTVPDPDSLSFLKTGPYEISSNSTSLFSEGISLEACVLKEMLKEQFSESLGAVLLPDSITSSEERHSQMLASAKYADSAWNMEGSSNENTTQA